MRLLLMDGLNNCLPPVQSRHLWLHFVDELTVRQIAGAENARHPGIVGCLATVKQTASFIMQDENLHLIHWQTYIAKYP